MNDIDPAQSVLWMVRGHWVALAIRAGVDLGVFDTLSTPQSPLTVLADAAEADRATIARLLQVFVDLGLVEADDDAYRRTPLGDTLDSRHPAAFASLVRLQTTGDHLAAWAMLADAIRSGDAVYPAVSGVTPWEHYATHPEELAAFNAAMARRGGEQAAAIRSCIDLDEVTTVVDVGGGKGGMLVQLLSAAPQLHGVVADLPDVAAEAETTFAAAGLTDRAAAVGASFFESAPSGGDAYVISNVLHDWSDDDCVRILRTVRAAMSPTARVWVVEKVLDAPRPFEDARDLHLVDLHMLVLFGARERTFAEYAALLSAAGFGPATLRDTGSRWNVVEARPS